MTLHTDLEGYMGIIDNRRVFGIRKKIQEGWEPTGDPQWISEEDSYFQVIVKKRQTQANAPVYGDYMLICEIALKDVNLSINSNMELGWIPYGGMHYQTDKKYNPWFWQAMVKPFELMDSRPDKEPETQTTKD